MNGHGNIMISTYSTASGQIGVSDSIFIAAVSGSTSRGPAVVSLLRDTLTTPVGGTAGAGVGYWGGPFPQGGLMGMCDGTVRMFPYNMTAGTAGQTVAGTLIPFLTAAGGEIVGLPDT
jgi:hypothetical protein